MFWNSVSFSMFSKGLCFYLSWLNSIVSPLLYNWCKIIRKSMSFNKMQKYNSSSSINCVHILYSQLTENLTISFYNIYIFFSSKLSFFEDTFRVPYWSLIGYLHVLLFPIRWRFNRLFPFVPFLINSVLNFDDLSFI